MYQIVHRRGEAGNPWRQESFRETQKNIVVIVHKSRIEAHCTNTHIDLAQVIAWSRLHMIVNDAGLGAGNPKRGP